MHKFLIGDSQRMERTKKSILVAKFGDYDCLKIGEFPLSPLDGNVEVQVKFCGLNFADLYTRLGLMPRKVPFVLGMECAGVVTRVADSATTDLKAGDHVVCYDWRGGMYSDMVREPPQNCFLLPKDVPLKDGAALFVNYLTAYFALFYYGNLKENETVLIKSCAGGAGWAATQLARTIGTNVKIIGTASKGKKTFCLANGVDHLLDNVNWQDQLREIFPRGVDVIIENEATEYRENSKLLKPLGRIVLIGSNKLVTSSKKIPLLSLLGQWFSARTMDMHDLFEHNRSVSGLHLGNLLESDNEIMRRPWEIVCRMYREGTIKPRIDSVWSFEDIADATKVLGERRNVGKVLLDVDATSKAEKD